LLGKLTSMPYTSQTEYGLPGEKDYQLRRAEIKIDGLKKGYYLILTSNNPTFNVSKDQLSYVDFFVSDLSYIERTLNNGGSEIAVSNRLTGKPIANAVVEAKFQTYNYTLRKYEWSLLKKGTTDQDGHFLIPPVSARENSRNIEFSITYNNDVIYSTNYMYQYYRDTTERTSIQTYFFTDRAIYRPGQTIYFKGIMVEYKGKTSKILTGKTSKVDLYDVNWQEKSTLNLTTNEFGSFQGSFVAPTGGLNGQMQIRDPHGAVYFRVEDYKRPKFEPHSTRLKGAIA